MYSDFPSATSTSVFEELVFWYLTGTTCLPTLAGRHGNPVGAWDRSVALREGGQFEGPIRLDAAVCFTTAVIGFKDDLSLSQRLALVGDLTLDRNRCADIMARVRATTPAVRENKGGQNNQAGPVRICSPFFSQGPTSEQGPGLVVLPIISTNAQ